jgi:hypothetical protein
MVLQGLPGRSLREGNRVHYLVSQDYIRKGLQAGGYSKREPSRTVKRIRAEYPRPDLIIIDRVKCEVNPRKANRWVVEIAEPTRHASSSNLAAAGSWGSIRVRASTDPVPRLFELVVGLGRRRVNQRD